MISREYLAENSDAIANSVQADATFFYHTLKRTQWLMIS